MNLNEISENIAFALGDQYNETLREAIKHTVIVYRAKLIRDDLSRNFMGYTDYLQSFTAELEKVDKFQGCTNCKIMRTKNKVANPLKFPMGKSSFKYVGQVDSNNAFVYSHFEEVKFLKNLQYQHGVIYFAWDMNYLYILNNLKVCNIRIEAVFSDPRDINLTCADSKLIFSDDRHFPISSHLLVTIEKGIINGDFPVIKDGAEVNIEADKV